MRITGHGWEMTPGEILGVEEIRGSDGRVLRENTDKVRQFGAVEMFLADWN